MVFFTLEFGSWDWFPKSTQALDFDHFVPLWKRSVRASYQGILEIIQCFQFVSLKNDDACCLCWWCSLSLDSCEQSLSACKGGFLTYQAFLLLGLLVGDREIPPSVYNLLDSSGPDDKWWEVPIVPASFSICMWVLFWQWWSSHLCGSWHGASFGAGIQFCFPSILCCSQFVTFHEL